MVTDPNAFLDSLRPEPGQAASSQQGLALARLTWRMAQHVEEGRLGAVYAGNTGFLLSKVAGRVKAPALAYVSREHLRAGSPWSGAPDIAVELRAGRAAEWLQAGTLAVLVLDAGAKTVFLYQRGARVQAFAGNDLLELPDVLPGWALRTGELFE
jgi:Uma2 family endonuclease